MTPRPLRTLLYVDDDDDIREIVTLSLTLTGELQVRSSSSGEQALAAMRADPPDLVVLDMMMPGMDGATVLRHMRADAGLRHIPVIFMTAKTSAPPASLQGLDAVGVIAKPFDPMTLSQQVKKLWESQ